MYLLRLKKLLCIPPPPPPPQVVVGAVDASDLEEFRFNLFCGRPLDPYGHRCAWCGTWEPLPLHYIRSNQVIGEEGKFTSPQERCMVGNEVENQLSNEKDLVIIEDPVIAGQQEIIQDPCDSDSVGRAGVSPVEATATNAAADQEMDQPLSRVPLPQLRFLSVLDGIHTVSTSWFYYDRLWPAFSEHVKQEGGMVQGPSVQRDPQEDTVRPVSISTANIYSGEECRQQ